MATRVAWCHLLGVHFRYPSRTLCQPLICLNRSVCTLNNTSNQSLSIFTCAVPHLDKELSYRLKKNCLPIFDQLVCHYSKNRDKKKSDKGHKKKVFVSEEVLAEVINVKDMQDKMQGAIEKLKDEYMKNLSLRSSSGSIETLPITFEGKEYILQDLAQVVRKNPKTIVINMAAFPQAVPTVLQALSRSGMNLNPQQDGTKLFIPIPKVTKEHRESLSKSAKSLFIKCRDTIKDIQNSYIKKVKNKEKDGLAKDVSFQISEYIMQVASEYVSTAESIMETKQQELLNA